MAAARLAGGASASTEARPTTVRVAAGASALARARPPAGIGAPAPARMVATRLAAGASASTEARPTAVRVAAGALVLARARPPAGAAAPDPARPAATRLAGGAPASTGAWPAAARPTAGAPASTPAEVAAVWPVVGALASARARLGAGGWGPVRGWLPIEAWSGAGAAARVGLPVVAGERSVVGVGWVFGSGGVRVCGSSGLCGVVRRPGSPGSALSTSAPSPGAPAPVSAPVSAPAPGWSSRGSRERSERVADGSGNWCARSFGAPSAPSAPGSVRGAEGPPQWGWGRGPVKCRPRLARWSGDIDRLCSTASSCTSSGTARRSRNRVPELWRKNDIEQSGRGLGTPLCANRGPAPERCSGVALRPPLARGAGRRAPRPSHRCATGLARPQATITGSDRRSVRRTPLVPRSVESLPTRSSRSADLSAPLRRPPGLLSGEWPAPASAVSG